MAEFDPDAFLNQTEPVATGSGFNPDAFLKEAEAEEFDRPIAAGLAGAARGLSFGTSDVALTQTGLVAPETLKKLEEYNPTASTVGEIAGVVAPSLVTGGAGLIGSAVKGAGSAVRGVSALGSLTEAAVLNSFAKEAATTTAKKILQTATATGARGAIEGAFYGAGQVVSEAALGDKDLNAEKILSTIGLSSLLGGGVGAGLSVAGSGIKALAEKAAPLTKSAFAKIRGISEDTIDLITKESDELNRIENLGKSPQESLLQYSDESAQVFRDKFDSFISDKTNQIDNILSDKNSQKKWSVNTILSEIDAVKNKISKGGVTVSEDVRTALAKVDRLKQNIINLGKINQANLDAAKDFDKFGKYVGIQKGDTLHKPTSSLLKNETVKTELSYVPKAKQTEAELMESFTGYGAGTERPVVVDWFSGTQVIPVELQQHKFDIGKLFLTPQQINTIRQQANDQAQSLYTKAFYTKEPSAEIYEGIANGARQLLDQIDPSIRKINKDIGSVISITKDLSRYGLHKPKELQGDTLVNLLAAGKTTQTKTSKLLNELDRLLGTDFEKRQKLATAVKDLNPENAFFRVSTGASLLGPGAAALLGSVGGAPLAAGMGATAALVQAPFLTKPLVKAGTKIAEAIEKAKPGVFMLADGRVIPSSIIPYLSAHVAALSQLKSKIDKYDREVKSQINAIVDPKSSKDFAMESVGLMPSRMTSDDIRSLEKMAERYAGLSNPAELADAVDKGLSEVSLVAPDLGKSLAANMTQQAAFLASKAPKNPYPPTSAYYSDWKPSEIDLAKFARYVAAVERPISVLKELKANQMPVEGVEVLKSIYPKTYNEIRSKFLDKMADKKLKFGYAKRLQISQLFDIELDPSISPKSIQFYQSTLASTPENNGNGASSNNGQSGIPMKTSLGMPTKAQQIEAR